MTARPLPRAVTTSFAGCILPLLCLAGSALAAPSARSPRPAAQPGTFIIEVTQGGGGTIVPDGFVSVPAGGSQAFDFIPDDCYRVADVQVDGESVGSVTGYTFTNVQSDHAIYAVFARQFFAITVTSGPGGTTIPSGAVSVACSANVQVDALASCLQQVTDLQVDGVSVGPLTSYTFTNVRADHTIHASFAASTTSISLSVTPTVPYCATPDTLVAHVGGPASGTVSFLDGGAVIGSASIVNGVATFVVNPPLAVGEHELTAFYPGTVCIPGAVSAPVSYVVPAIPNAPPVVVSLSVAENPVEAAHPIALTATLSATGIPATQLNGAVEFSDGATSLGVVSASDGVATITYAFTTGQHDLLARYRGDSCLEPAVSPVVTLDAFQAVSQVAVSGSPNPSIMTGDVSISATIYSGGAIATSATGAVEFREGGSVFGTGSAQSGVATFRTSNMTVGSHLIEARYLGDASYSSSSATYTQRVYPLTRLPTGLTLVVNPNPPTVGQPTTWTATIAPAEASGEVTFTDGSLPAGTATLQGEVATIAYTFAAAGRHVLHAAYSGDAVYAPSATTLVIQLLARPALSSYPNPAAPGTFVTFVATVPGATGTMTFYIDGIARLPVPMINGTATDGSASLSLGNHSVYAHYSGDIIYPPADSDPLIQVIEGTPDRMLRVLAPNGGETLIIGGNTEIRWDPWPSIGVATLYVARQLAPPEWELIGTVPNTGSYTWTVTGPETNSALIAAIDLSGMVGSDASNLPFAIIDGATPTVVTRLDAEPSDEGIRVTWLLTNAGQFARLELQRAPAEVGPWHDVFVPVREQNGMSVAEDRSTEAGRTYWYRLVGTTASGAQSVFGPVTVTAPARELLLSAVSANPTRGPLRLLLALPRAMQIRLALYDAQGREAAELAKGEYPAGRYQVDWDGRSGRGAVGPGVYFAELVTPGKRVVTRVAIVQ